ncbi:MAG: NAD(P)-binding domain-containing protein, partial [Bacteroidetes bacterium]|jgi:glycerol-3-phosphate dehydrogenase (NAD(P)+)|nr:NAD(P)-binding domain-containing protein [Bacteroidota bacterium]MBT3932973.1 NAD(P)-binding domain-containing protein [Bacteroidota bacterium]MBT4730131.1 NAD(P)-binding domain-containing protein [Bacteroidota bacterium]MBT6836663.1 NAD(P)-binding domain-containing protein [Bacteroidota bacterium]MBT7039433.1 NAD(P)-binding domain-containing protein [Bacteroidota bacterium]
MTKIGVIGGGSYGTAIVKTLLDKDGDVFWWLRKQDTIDSINLKGRNPKYLRAVDLKLKPEQLSTDIREICRQSDIIFIAVPSVFLRETLLQLDDSDMEGKLIVSTTKGLIPHDHQLISDYIIKNFHLNADQFIFLTGPAHAEEVVTKRKTYLTLASSSEENALRAGSFLETDYIAVRTSTDVPGLEYAAVLKNIYAIAAGISQSVGYGDNFLAVLMSNAIREMDMMLKQECPADRNLMSSGYLGDLLVTAFSKFSRNRTFGSMIGHGYSTKAALIEMNMIPEGHYAVKSFCKLMRESCVKLRIVSAVYKILYNQEDPLKTLQALEEGFD